LAKDKRHIVGIGEKIRDGRMVLGMGMGSATPKTARTENSMSHLCQTPEQPKNAKEISCKSFGSQV